MKKRILSTLLCIAMLLTLAPAALADTQPTFSVSNETAAPGEDVTVTLTLSGNTGIAGMYLQLEYDSALTLKSITVPNGEPVQNSPATDLEGNAQDTKASLTFTMPGDLSANPISLLWDGIENYTQNGTMLTLVYHVDENATPGEKGITVTYATGAVFAADQSNNFSDVALTIQNGSVTVAEAQAHTPGDINGDGKVNNRDVMLLAQYVAKWPVTVVESALDVNGDTKVNNRDVMLLAQYVAKWPVEIH